MSLAFHLNDLLFNAEPKVPKEKPKPVVKGVHTCIYALYALKHSCATSSHALICMAPVTKHIYSPCWYISEITVLCHSFFINYVLPTSEPEVPKEKSKPVVKGIVFTGTVIKPK